jgi:hypothetical protein
LTIATATSASTDAIARRSDRALPPSQITAEENPCQTAWVTITSSTRTYGRGEST